MNRRNGLMLVAAVFGAGAMTNAMAASLTRAEGEFAFRFGRLTYDPSSGCTKPNKPYGSDDRYARESYISSARTYLSCMKSAAEADQDYATKVVAEGYEEQSDEFLSEMRRAY